MCSNYQNYNLKKPYYRFLLQSWTFISMFHEIFDVFLVSFLYGRIAYIVIIFSLKKVKIIMRGIIFISMCTLYV